MWRWARVAEALEQRVLRECGAAKRDAFVAGARWDEDVVEAGLACNPAEGGLEGGGRGCAWPYLVSQVVGVDEEQVWGTGKGYWGSGWLTCRSAQS